MRVCKFWNIREVEKKHYGNSTRVVGNKEKPAKVDDDEIMMIPIFIRLSQ